MNTAGLIGENTFPAMTRAEWAGVPHLAAPSMDGSGSGWTIVQRVDDPDPTRANAQARDDLANGAGGLSIVFEGAPNAFGYGLPASQQALAAALAGIDLDRVHLRIDAHPAGRASAEWLAGLLASRRADPARVSLSFGIDPAAIFAGTGRLRMSVEALKASMPQSLAHFFGLGIPGVLLEADGRVFHNAGATAAQELGIAIACAVSHLRLFAKARQALVHAVPHIGFALAADQDAAETAAKTAALHKLWHEVQRRSSMTPVRARVHAETSFRMLTARNVDLNTVRSAIGAAAAGGAGADTVTLLPRSIARGLPGPAARRQALEAHRVVLQEGGADRLRGTPLSPDFGDLVDALCEEAWAEFRRIDAEGGALRSIEAGRLQERVRRSRDELALLYSGGGRVLVGAGGVDTHDHADMIAVDRANAAEEGVAFCDRLDPVRIEESLG